jgi:hypothetical protein
VEIVNGAKRKCATKDGHGRPLDWKSCRLDTTRTAVVIDTIGSQLTSA